MSGHDRGMGFSGFAMGSSSASGSFASNFLSRQSAMKTQAEKEREYYALQSGEATSKKSRHYDDDEFLEQEDDLEYQPAPGSPGGDEEQKVEEEEEDDPLDAYMAGIEKQAAQDKQVSDEHSKQTPAAPTDENQKKKDQLGRTDIDEEDMQESYFRFLEEAKLKADADDDDDLCEYDEDGNPIFTWKKSIDPLPPLDHSEIEYQTFERNLYNEHDEIKSLNDQQVADLRNTLGLKVSGLRPPRPVSSFAHFGFDKELMNAVRKAEYFQPTPIQAQAIPAALTGRDIIGIAKTGSGKTVAYLWPGLVHLMAQRQLEEDEGPIVLIVVPTRELAIQVYNESKKFGKVYGLRVVCAYGGGSKWEQTNALAAGAEIVVATPGRMIDLIKIAATNFKRVTYLVFDEADRMFDLGFEAQVRSIANHVRPDRQCMLFSATFKKKVERLARDVLTDPVRIVQGEIGEANQDIIQTVEVVPSVGRHKWNWLLERLVSFCTLGKVLIFVTKKLNAEELAKNLKLKDFQLVLLHGDMLQHERNEVLQTFRKTNLPILVATDVAARGLDIPEIKTVVNFDVARDIDTHIHRVGRTGRAGEIGSAFTLVTEKDKEFAGHLVRNLESVNQTVSHKLMDLAMQSSWFRSSRFKEGKAKPGIGGRGLGYTETKPSGSGTGSAPTSKPAPSPTKISKLGSNSNAAGGGRLASMRAAFSAAYTSKFQAASGEDSGMGKRPVSDPKPEWKKKLEEVQKQIEASEEPQTKKKRSRWD